MDTDHQMQERSNAVSQQKTATPVVFVSHGSPLLLFSPEAPSYQPLMDWPERLHLDDPSFGVRAILMISAHWTTALPTLSATLDPATVHDFEGFPSRCYDLWQCADGAPDVAAEVVDCLQTAGIVVEPVVDMQRGLDQASWSPLMMAFPAAELPVAVLSVQPDRPLCDHMALGAALAPLRKRGLLIVGSGGSVHNLDYWAYGEPAVAAWAHRFDDALAQAVERGDGAAVCALLETADGRLAHPHADHIAPLLTVMGAASKTDRCVTLHRGVEDGAMGMSAFAFCAETSP